jgi:hypothetical protein
MEALTFRRHFSTEKATYPKYRKLDVSFVTNNPTELWRRGWRWRQQDPRKHPYPKATLHDDTTQQKINGIFMAVKASNLAILEFHLQCEVASPWRGNMVLRNVGIVSQHYTVSQPRILQFYICFHYIFSGPEKNSDKGRFLFNSNSVLGRCHSNQTQKTQVSKTKEVHHYQNWLVSDRNHQRTGVRACARAWVVIPFCLPTMNSVTRSIIRFY